MKEPTSSDGMICVSWDWLVRVALAVMGALVLFGVVGCTDIIITAPTEHRAVPRRSEDRVKVVIVDRAPAPVDICKVPTLLPVPGC